MAIQYLTDRGFTRDTISRFSIGLTLGKTVEEKALNSISAKTIADYGLRSTSTGSPTFTNRIMIPFIRDNKIVGFTGRTMNFLPKKYQTNFLRKLDDFYEKELIDPPKYVNSRETKFYKKENFLFNFDKMREIEPVVYITESEQNAIAIDQLGGRFPSLALGGTAISEYNFTQLKNRGVSMIVWVLDPDNAGRKATREGIVKALKHGTESYVVSLPNGKDVVDLLPNKKVLISYLRRLQDGIDYYLDYLSTLAPFEMAKEFDKFWDETSPFLKGDMMPLISGQTIVHNYMRKKLGLPDPNNGLEFEKDLIFFQKHLTLYS
jgi:DNA primase